MSNRLARRTGGGTRSRSHRCCARQDAYPRPPSVRTNVRETTQLVNEKARRLSEDDHHPGGSSNSRVLRHTHRHDSDTFASDLFVPDEMVGGADERGVVPLRYRAMWHEVKRGEKGRAGHAVVGSIGETPRDLCILPGGRSGLAVLSEGESTRISSHPWNPRTSVERASPPSDHA